MLIRALIVLLLALNLGVAGWWLLRAPPAASVPQAPNASVATLQLVDEPSDAIPGSAATSNRSPPQSSRNAPAPANVCLALGPFADADDVARARVALQPMSLIRVRERQVPTGPIRGWSVQVPPLDNLDAAQALATRVAAAGFSDYFVVREGAQANAVALGRYGNEASARARADALVAAGFPARADPIRSGAQTIWLDIVAASGFDPDSAQTLAGAAQRETQQCAQAQ